MFDRTGLKLQARDRMRGSLGNAILVALICALLIGDSSFDMNFNFDQSTEQMSAQTDYTESLADMFAHPMFVGIFSGVLLLAVISGVCYTIFFANILKVGQKGWFMRYSRSEYPSVGQLFASLRIYKPAMATMLLHDVYIFLWSLLFIVPGIVKSYAHRLVPYIIYENPNLSPSEVLRLSEDMMKGYKLEMFLFDWSFFWWNLLSAITAGIVGIVYVQPYINTAEAYVYDAIKHDAVYYRGIVAPEVFGMPPAPAQP